MITRILTGVLSFDNVESKKKTSKATIRKTQLQINRCVFGNRMFTEGGGDNYSPFK